MFSRGHLSSKFFELEYNIVNDNLYLLKMQINLIELFSCIQKNSSISEKNIYISKSFNDSPEKIRKMYVPGSPSNNYHRS